MYLIGLWICLECLKKFKSNTAERSVIQDTASSSTLISLIAAREYATKGDFNIDSNSKRLTAYVSSQSHSSIEKAIKVAGLGRNAIRIIDVDDAYAMIPEKLTEQIQTDINQGYTPAFVCATVGSTNTTAIDPVLQLGKICKEYNVWLHVDAAMAGAAACAQNTGTFKKG